MDTLIAVMFLKNNCKRKILLNCCYFLLKFNKWEMNRRDSHCF